ncbi:MAG: DUF2249 domain-containing protein [Magnetococcales bacterium]|nr:DUF2249 domain-containing protein [Magnetococcales bacterium]
MSKSLDVRHLPSPEPMIHILEAVTCLSPGDILHVRHNRIPRLLYPRLQERGVAVTTEELPDGDVILTIRRPEQTDPIDFE